MNSVEAILLKANIELAWDCWSDSEKLQEWFFPNSCARCLIANHDFRVGGNFDYRMETQDGSGASNFSGRFTEIEERQRIMMETDDARVLYLTFFESDEDEIEVTLCFEESTEIPAEEQLEEWQQILTRFETVVSQYTP